MSGYGGPQLANRTAALGVDSALRKPLHRRELPMHCRACSSPVLDRPGEPKSMPETLGAHILVVDDDPQVRSLLRSTWG